MSIVFILHVFTTFFMTGLCWFVQVVHYPLFRYIRLEDLALYEQKNLRTGYIAVPVMVIELLTGLWLWWQEMFCLNFINIGLLVVIGLSTVILQGPLHVMMGTGATEKDITKLIKTNWIRTISWTVRSGLLGYLMLK